MKTTTMLLRIPSVLAAAALLLGCAFPQEESTTEKTSTAKNAAFSVYIAHVNDTHSAFDPIGASVTANFNAGLAEPHFAKGQMLYTEFGGHPRLLSKVERYRAQAEAAQQPFLLLHGGDAWQGTAYFKLNEGLMNADILSQFGFDAMALGNHEFDLTNAHLNAFLERVNFPMVAANIDTTADPDLADQANLMPYVIYAMKGNEKQRITSLNELRQVEPDYTLVALFGLALDSMATISSNTGAVQFFEMVSAAQQTVDELTVHGIEHIIAVTHIGHSEDLRVAQNVNGIDAIVGGHSHTLLGDFTNLGWDFPGEYAQRVVNPDGQGTTCVVQAGQYATAVGLLNIQFDQQGRVAACDGGNTLLSDGTFYLQSRRAERDKASDIQHQYVGAFIATQRNIAIVEEQQRLRAHIDQYYKPALNEAYGDVLGFVPQTVTHVRLPGQGNSGSQGSGLAPLVAESQFQWFMRPEVQALTGLTPDFALVGAGGIRQSLSQGELREGDIALEMLPFASPLSIVPLTGQQVHHLLTEVLLQVLPEGAHAGKFPYGGRIRYHFREQQRGVSGELVSVEVNRGTLATPNWQPLDLNARYNVVMSAYSAAGNDGWLAVYEAQREQSQRIDIAYVDNQLTAFNVERVSQENGQRLQTLYRGEALNCSAPAVNCALDAKALIEFFRADSDRLQPLPYPVVNFERSR
ncbi:bifunctional metallophosphatase/5'-nucleotidase [Aliidiomarina celeris]|uniref:bifunctional metallophosphatase/5'-nucleotidase n=1 Tax=Aliidiomarina celeris TaxID=2249428 RepID=UPI001E58CE3C|nr:bifunctional metallophosphatase/5'-nucleotidase [Aliidiomarina celeris]